MTEGEQIKRSRSTELTGGAGFTYEDTVAAYYLTALLREDGAAAISGRISRVAVQQASQGEPLDDLVVDADSFGEPRRLSLQVKRQLTISAAESNTDFRDLIANSIKTRAKAGFRVSVDRYGFIARTVGEERLASLQRIVSWAQASPTGAEFDSRFSGEANQGDINLRHELKALVQPQNPDQEADFYRHFVALRMDGLEPGGDRFTELANRLGELTAAGTQYGPLIAETLCRLVRRGQGVGEVWTRPTLLRELRPLIRLKVAPSYASDVQTLLDPAKSFAADIREDIGGIAIDRSELVDEAQRAAAVFRVSNISGLPGCGKSVVLRHFVERVIAVGPVLFLKSDRIEATSWAAFATSIGLQHRLPELLAEIGAAGTPILFIDGIDRIRPEHRGVITDVLNAIERNPSLADWHVVASSRDQGLEAFRQWVPASFYKTTGIGDVPVNVLSDKEAESLAEHKPYLRRLLFGAPAVREIARRPFFAAVLAERFGADGWQDEAPPQSESELIAAWWRAGGYNATADAVLGRQRAIINLAEAGATSLGKAISARRLDAATISQVSELKRDRIIDVVVEGSVFSFAHDIFFEWAFFRLLIDHGPTWLDAVVAAGEPPLLARVVGLLSQHTFETNSDWPEQFQSLSGRQLRPQWRRAWLLGPPDSAKFIDQLRTFESLLFADGAVLLVKFLVWFQAERTIPNPLFLKTPNPVLESAALIRAADRWGWPSDLAVWQRVLSWVLAREAIFPAVAVPHAVELFAVFQNMLGDTPNPLSMRLIEAAEAWLIELETPRTIINGRSAHPTRWDGLPDGARTQLMVALRQLILRSGRAYPDAARRIVERAISDSPSQGLFESIVVFSPILAQVCPERLAKLVRAEVFEELPRDDLEEGRRQREARYQRLREIRAKPEKDLTDIEKRMLSAPNFIDSEKSYDFNDVGIDYYHRAFFPPSPLHQPFASLFDLAPDIARQLVRDIGNRATMGWRQVHEINAPRCGTPIPLDIEFPWGKQCFWGDMRTYAWFLGEMGAQPLEAAYLALTYWAHKRLDAGDDVDEVIRAVVEGHESWTVLGLAASLALEKDRVSETVLPLVTAQRLWHADLVRQVQNPGAPINLLGLDPREGMTPDQRAASDYLLKRRFRERSIRDLTPLFALGRDETLRAKLKDALSRFPEALPFSYEEERASAPAKKQLLETARIWAGWGNSENYKVEGVPERPGTVAVTFEAPEPQPEEWELRRQENSKVIADFNVVAWANNSLRDGKLNPQYDLKVIIDFARSRDSTELFTTLAKAGEGARQAGVAAAAAVVAVYSAVREDAAWAWSVFARVLRIEERGDAFQYGKNSMDPRLFLIAAVFHCLRKGQGRPEFGEQLLVLAADPNHHIAQTAMTALLRLTHEPHLCWVAAAMATELFLMPVPEMGEDGNTDRSVRAEHRLDALQRALSRLNNGSVVTLAPPPAAWTFAPRRQRSWDDSPPTGQWRFPDFDFLPSVAASIVGEFPIESWAGSPQRREAFLTYLQQLIGWTADRLFPSWADESKRRRRSTDMFEWLRSLGDLVARASALVSAHETIDRFISPISRHQHDDAIRFIADFTKSLVCRSVYDAPVVTYDTLTILKHCLDRMLQESEFRPRTYRAGEIHGFDLPPMIQALLLVSVKDAPGAARFANDDWRDLPRLMPIVDTLMKRAGRSRFVMETYLTLCERADNALPIEAFTGHVIPNIEAQKDSPQMWSDSAIPARIAGVVQRLAETNYPLSLSNARNLLEILDRLVDMGDRRSAALEQSEYFRGVQLTA